MEAEFSGGRGCIQTAFILLSYSLFKAAILVEH